MEALGAASSIAGLLSLVGQSIDGITKLRGFVKDVKSASKTVTIFLRDVDSFQQSLSHIQHLLGQLPQDQHPTLDDSTYDICLPVLEAPALDDNEKSRKLEEILADKVSVGFIQEAVDEIVRKYKSQSQGVPKQDLDSLKWQLEECWNDIEGWTTLAQKLNPGSATGVEAFFKKLRVAINKDGFSEFHSQIARHQRGLGITLSVLAPTLSLLGLSQLELLNGQFRIFEQTQSRRDVEITQIIGRNMSAFATQETISRTISDKVDPLKSWMEDSIVNPLAQQLERVETSTRVSVTYSREGSENLKALSDAVSSLGTQMSQLKKMVSKGLRRSPSMPSNESVSDVSMSEESDDCSPSIIVYEYSCHAIIGIEEGFVGDMCVYCGAYFTTAPHRPIDWRVRGLHLATDHSFSDCDSDVSYLSRSECRRHLEKYHNSRYSHQEEVLFRRCAGEIQHLSRARERESFSTGGEVCGRETSLSDSTSEPSCLAELETDLQNCLYYIEQADVEFTANSLSELRRSTLELFWDANWKINCLRERYTILELAFPLDAYFAMLSEDNILNGMEGFPNALGTAQLLQNVWQNFLLENSSKVYVDESPTQYRFSHTIATWAKFWIEKGKESLSFKNIQQNLRFHLPFHPLPGQSATTSFSKKMEVFKSIYVDEVDQGCPADLGTDFVKDLLILKLASNHSLVQQKPTKIIRDHLISVESSVFHRVHRALGERAMIDRWLLQILQQSRTTRALCSQHSEARNPSSPRILPWVFKTLENWTEDNKNPDSDHQPYPTDGAIDSRDDLLSRRDQVGIVDEHIFTCECCPETPSRFETANELKLHESQAQYECAYCSQRFMSMSQAKRHQFKIHLSHESWSCPGSGSFQAVFLETVAGADTCEYCGEIFSPRLKRIHNSCMTESWLARKTHLVTHHSFGDCNSGVSHAFHTSDEFRQHLVARHAATLGPWTAHLEEFCKENKSIPGVISREPSVLDRSSNAAHTTRGTCPQNLLARPAPASRKSENSKHNMIDTSSGELPGRFAPHTSPLPSPSSVHPECNIDDHANTTLPLLNFEMPVSPSPNPSPMREDVRVEVRERHESQSGQDGGNGEMDRPEPDGTQLNDPRGLPLRPRSASGSSLYRNAILSPRHQQDRNLPLLGRRRLSLPKTSSLTPEGPDQTAALASHKQHKCPYCDTEFTRHHNLKSHLLTHSQVKPYICQMCQMRFRRLHDLKRHAKLHVGEPTYSCPKCGAQFARRDGLAFHIMGLCHTKKSRPELSGTDHNSGMSNVGGDNEIRMAVQSEGASPPADLSSASNQGIAQYVQALEDKIKQLTKNVNWENDGKNQEDSVKRLKEEVNYLQGQIQAQSQVRKLHVSPLTPGSASSMPYNIAAYKDSTIGLETGPETPAGKSNGKKRKGHQSDDEYAQHKRPRPLEPQHMTYQHYCHKMSSLVESLPKSAEVSAVGTVQEIALLAGEMESLITAGCLT